MMDFAAGSWWHLLPPSNKLHDENAAEGDERDGAVVNRPQWDHLVKQPSESVIALLERIFDGSLPRRHTAVRKASSIAEALPGGRPAATGSSGIRRAARPLPQASKEVVDVGPPKDATQFLRKRIGRIHQRKSRLASSAAPTANTATNAAICGTASPSTAAHPADEGGPPRAGADSHCEPSPRAETRSVSPSGSSDDATPRSPVGQPPSSLPEHQRDGLPIQHPPRLIDGAAVAAAASVPAGRTVSLAPQASVHHLHPVTQSDVVDVSPTVLSAGPHLITVVRPGGHIPEQTLFNRPASELVQLRRHMAGPQRFQMPQIAVSAATAIAPATAMAVPSGPDDQPTKPCATPRIVAANAGTICQTAAVAQIAFTRQAAAAATRRGRPSRAATAPITWLHDFDEQTDAPAQGFSQPSAPSSNDDVPSGGLPGASADRGVPPTAAARSAEHEVCDAHDAVTLAVAAVMPHAAPPAPHLAIVQSDDHVGLTGQAGGVTLASSAAQLAGPSRAVAASAAQPAAAGAGDAQLVIPLAEPDVFDIADGDVLFNDTELEAELAALFEPSDDGAGGGPAGHSRGVQLVGQSEQLVASSALPAPTSHLEPVADQAPAADAATAVCGHIDLLIDCSATADGAGCVLNEGPVAASADGTRLALGVASAAADTELNASAEGLDGAGDRSGTEEGELSEDAALDLPWGGFDDTPSADAAVTLSKKPRGRKNRRGGKKQKAAGAAQEQSKKGAAARGLQSQGLILDCTLKTLGKASDAGSGEDVLGGDLPWAKEQEDDVDYEEVEIGLFADIKRWDQEQRRLKRKAGLDAALEPGHRANKYRIEEKRTAICRFWKLGRCNQGAECAFLHEGLPAVRLVVCSFHQAGKCTKGDDCAFSHDADTLDPCQSLLTTGMCSQGALCQFSHEALVASDADALCQWYSERDLGRRTTGATEQRVAAFAVVDS